MSRSSCVRGACLAFAAVLAAQFASAQESTTYASVSGRVTDPSGAVVQGAVVTARQLDTNLTARGQSDRDGRFRFPYLRVGPYEISAHQQGFTDVTRSLTLSVGSAFELPISLTIASAEATDDTSSATIRRSRGSITPSHARPQRAAHHWSRSGSIRQRRDYWEAP